MNSGTFETRTGLRSSSGLVILRPFVQTIAEQRPALTTRLAVLAVGALALAPFAGAHHSRVEFVDEVRELEGELLEIVWLNPHPALFVEVRNEDGTTETWRVEAHSLHVGIDNGGTHELEATRLQVPAQQIGLSALSRIRNSKCLRSSRTGTPHSVSW